MTKLIASVYLKGGQVIYVHCDDLSVSKQNGNDLVGYSFTGAVTGESFYFRIDDISAITYKPNPNYVEAK